jgi:hypothetical protein
VVVKCDRNIPGIDFAKINSRRSRWTLMTPNPPFDVTRHPSISSNLKFPCERTHPDKQNRQWSIVAKIASR